MYLFLVIMMIVHQRRGEKKKNLRQVEDHHSYFYRLSYYCCRGTQNGLIQQSKLLVQNGLSTRNPTSQRWGLDTMLHFVAKLKSGPVIPCGYEEDKNLEVDLLRVWELYQYKYKAGGQVGQSVKSVAFERQAPCRLVVSLDWLANIIIRWCSETLDETSHFLPAWYNWGDIGYTSQIEEKYGSTVRAEGLV